MFKKLKNLAQRGHQATVDPSSFSDPLAEQVDWSPLSPGGANFRTHRLVPVSDFRLEFRSTLGARLFALVFLTIGLLAPVVIIFAEGLEAGEIFASGPFWFGLVIGLTFAGAGVFLYREFCSPVVFNKDTREFTRKQPRFRKGGQGGAPSFPIDLQTIHALQIVREWVKSSDSSYYSYELNVVLSDGRRAGVVDHGNRGRLVSDADVLSAFLGVPLWDGSSEDRELSKPEDD